MGRKIKHATGPLLRRVAVLQGYIYAMGGFDGEGRTSSCERDDASRNQWEFFVSVHVRARSPERRLRRGGRRAHLHYGRMASAIGCRRSAADRLRDRQPIAEAMMDGFTGREVLDSVECYDPSVDAWSYVRACQVPAAA